MSKTPKRFAIYSVTGCCKLYGGEDFKLYSEFVKARSEKEALSRFNYRIKTTKFHRTAEAKLIVTQPRIRFLYFCE